MFHMHDVSMMLSAPSLLRSPGSLGQGELHISCQPQGSFPTYQERRLSTQSTTPVISEEGKEGKASSHVSCPCRTLISSPELKLQLNTNTQSGSKGWGKGGDTRQSAFNLICATCPTGSLCELTAVLLAQQISF